MRHDVGFLSFRVGNREEFVLPAWYNTPCKLPKGEKYMQLFNPDSRFSQFIYSVLDYVNLNNLSATQYQDEGWDPVKLPK